MTLLDPSQPPSAAPNRVRDSSTATPCSSFGTLAIRRTVTNNTGGDVTSLRFRVVIITTAPAPSGIADLRPISSSDVSVVVGGVTRTVRGTTLDNAGGVLPNNCGGFNTSLSVGAVTAAPESLSAGSVVTSGSQQEEGEGTPEAQGAPAGWETVNLNAPLANGASLDVQFLLGVQQTGLFRFYVIVEALP